MGRSSEEHEERTALEEVQIIGGIGIRGCMSLVKQRDHTSVKGLMFLPRRCTRNRIPLRESTLEDDVHWQRPTRPRFTRTLKYTV